MRLNEEWEVVKSMCLLADQENSYTHKYMRMLSTTSSHTENFLRETEASISALL